MYTDLASYYHRWYHPKPVLVTPERREELRTLHRVLYRAVERLVTTDWRPVAERWGFSEKEKAILEEQARHPFRAGTWRPDYLIGADGSLKICEITSRFFAHGIFMSWFGDRFARSFLEREFPDLPHRSRFAEMMDYMLGLVGERERIFVLKSADKTNEIRLYKRFYEAHGKTVTVLEADEIEPRMAEWSDGACLLGALNQKDILSLKDRTLQAMIEARMISDFRNIFLIHDKRFMTRWFEDGFLSGPDAGFLRAHAIRTWDTADPSSAAAVADAIRHKDGYIFKPARLGKSEGVIAGPLTSPEAWTALWESSPKGILQPFLRQRPFPTVWEGTPFDDYLCGMMLCVDDKFFDSGYFRGSSLPVTNVGDDRKAAVLHASDAEETALLAPYCDIL